MFVKDAVIRPMANDNRSVTKVDVDGTLLNVEPIFCCLGDMLCAGGGCKLAIINRCGIAWGKFMRILPILTFKFVSLRTRGKVFNICVRSALLHGSESWAPTGQTYSWFTGMTDQWSTGSAEAEMTTN